MWGEARGLFWETFLDRPCVGFVKSLSDFEETLLRYFNRFRFVVGWSGALRSMVFFFTCTFKNCSYGEEQWILRRSCSTTVTE